MIFNFIVERQQAKGVLKDGAEGLSGESQRGKIKIFIHLKMNKLHVIEVRNSDGHVTLSDDQEIPNMKMDIVLKSKLE